MDYSRLTIVNQNAIINKAKTKNNGVYTLRGIEYRVIDGRVTHYACLGKILEAAGHFNVECGNYDGYADSARKILKGIK